MTQLQMADRIAAMRSELAAMEAALRRSGSGDEVAKGLGLPAITKLGDLEGMTRGQLNLTEEEIDAALYGRFSVQTTS